MLNVCVCVVIPENNLSSQKLASFMKKGLNRLEFSK